MNGVASMTPSQQKAATDLIACVKTKAAPLVELRSPPALGRGYGVTHVLKAVADQLGAPLLGVATALKDLKGDFSDGQAVKAVYDAAVASLEKHGVAIIDDLDLACAPRSVRRSRTLIGDIKGSGDIFNWEVAPAPAMLLKALGDAAATAANGVLVFSSVEDAHLAFIKAPLTITLEESSTEDYASILKAMSTQVDAEAVYALHSQLSPADLKASVARVLAKGDVSTEALLSSIRDELVSVSAVAPEEVEPVDLADFPGLENIKDELERNVLFPLEHPDQAKKFGLTPKRGVLLHGQPGTGKTTVGRWLANRLKGKFFLVREMMLQADIIKVFAAAQAAAPAVVFIDDADIVIGGWRPLDGHRGSDVFRFLLGRMDGLTSRGKRQRENGDVVVMLTGQNVHWMADMLLRSGRIELWLKTKLPEPRQKRRILEKYIKEDPGALELLGKNGELPDVTKASQESDNFCCADLRRVVSDAKMLAAWDRSAAKKVLEGSEYLEKAASGVRRMQDEVHSNARNLYG